MMDENQGVLDAVKRWFENAVLGLNLCPFAHRPYRLNSILFSLSTAVTDEACLTDLHQHLQRLDRTPKLETIVMICPRHLQDFAEYNQFLDLADQLLEQEGLQELYQVASFHPDYQFKGSQQSDRSNWTNRSPFPILHLLRQQSISTAINSFPDVNAIPQRNVSHIESLSEQEMVEIFGEHYLKGS